MKKTDVDLVRAIQEWAPTHKGERFGQWLFNLLASYDGRGLNYDEGFHSRLFYLEDYDLVQIIEKATEVA